MAPSEDRPVLTGLLALVGVGLVVGLVLGGVALVATQVLGIDGEESAEGASSGASMYLPTPSETQTPSGPMMTLATEDGEASEPADPAEETEKKAKKKPTLTVAQDTVSPMQRIDLSGTYPQGEGAILQVERFVDGGWTDFPVTASVSNETFSTYVQTGQTGENRFRVRDTDSGKVSNEVTVTIG
ncbi:hypothetical protein [Nocardioides pantholopis]|uniref:hypothetical protein n=1 Tax=Nocardioides pantholopis TaxID=2483798 RepID=UPI000FDBBDA0|nr:hypothetical protein [Nocardioides pantholopis]